MTVYIDENNCIRVQEMTAQQKAFKVAFLLADGRCLTTAQVAEMTGLTLMGAWYLLHNGAGAVEITQDDDGRWYRLK